MPGVAPNQKKVKVKKVLRKKKEDPLKPKFNWVDHCYEETMLSNPNWEKIQEKIGRVLAVKLEARLGNEITDEVHQQVLFSLLGRKFVEEYLVAHNYRPALLGNHDIAENDYNKLVNRLKRMVESDVNKAYNELGYSNLSMNEMREYRNDVQQQFSNTLETVLKQNKKEEISGNIVGKAFMKVLHRDPSSIIPVINRLREQVVPMPNTLRKCIYIHQLLKKAEEKDDTMPNDVMALKKQLREFLMASKGGHDRIQPIRSEEWRKIDEAVIDLYHNTPGLKGIDTDEHLMTTSRVLNLLEKANDNYRQSLIYWLCPFLLAFESYMSLLRDDALIEVAALFHLVDRFLIPSHAEIFSITSDVASDILDADKEFYNHLTNCMKIDPVFNAKDFTKEVLHIEHEKAEKLLADLHSDPQGVKSLKIITNPQTYMRRWVADGFLNCLRLNGALFVWDQMFYAKWESQIVKNVLIVISMLLKPWFLRADNYSEIRRVFMEEPARLYTADIRRALRHIFEKKSINDVSTMNRNILLHNETPPPPPAVYHPPPESPAPVPVIIPLPVVPLSSESDESSSESESELEALKSSESEPEELEPDIEPEPEPEVESDPELDEREDISSAWLPFNKGIKKKLPTPSRMNAPFDLYVDAIRFLPDNATIVKVTGKILNSEETGKNEDPDVMAYANLKSPAKCPEFRFKLPVRREQILLNPNVVLLLRAYTVETVSNELVILGSCLFNIFRNKPSKPVQLRVGGHQVRLRRGFPKSKNGNLSSSDMDENLPIPCATILFRLLPHSEEFIEMPDYSTHYYRSKHSLPNYSECNIYEDFMQRSDRDQTVAVMMKTELKQSGDNKKLETIMRKALERKKSSPRQINLYTLINYNKEYGIALLAEEAHRLPVHMSGKIFHTILQILPGKRSFKETKTFTVCTEKLDLESSHLDPNWMDSPSKVNPYYDENSVLFVQVFGLNVDYQFPEHRKPGKINGKNGNELNLDLDHPLAWTVIPMFKNGVVNCGTFLAPLVKHYPNKKIIQSLQNQTVEKTYKTLTDEIKFCESSSIEVTLWDGHFITTECPPLTKTNHLIKLTPKASKYMKAIEAKNQTSFIDLLINQKVQMEGPEAWLMGSDSTKVQEDFVKNFNATFMKLLDVALQKKKLDPVSSGGVDDQVNDESDYDSDDNY